MKKLVLCHTCRIKHLATNQQDADEFYARHRDHFLSEAKPDAMTLVLANATKANLFRVRDSTWRKRVGSVVPKIIWPWQKHDVESVIEFDRMGCAGYADNANVKQAFGGEVSFDLTSLNSLAGSVTAGWQSQYVDNTTNLYVDALTYGKFATGGTAGGEKQIMFFLYGATNTTDFPVTGAATGGTTGASASAGGALTFLDVTAQLCPLPCIYTMPTLTSNIQIVTPAISLMASVQGPLMPFWGLGLINQANWTFASSGNAIKYDPIYYTVS